MRNSYNITALVKTAQKDAPLPPFDQIDEQTRRRLEREAEKQNTTAAALYAVILAQAEQDAADTFDADAVAKAARR